MTALTPGTRSNTDWVLTFPGKHEFYAGVPTPVPPYTAVLTSNGACETALFTFFDRDEQSANPPTTAIFPSAAPRAQPPMAAARRLRACEAHRWS